MLDGYLEGKSVPAQVRDVARYETDIHCLPTAMHGIETFWNKRRLSRHQRHGPSPYLSRTDRAGSTTYCGLGGPPLAHQFLRVLVAAPTLETQSV